MRSAISARHLTTALLLAAVASSAGAQARSMSIEDVMNLKNVGSVALSPDGSRIVYTVSAWEHPAARDTSKGDKHEMRSHLWIVPTAGGDARQLTFGERGESNPQWSPDGRSISFVAARGTGAGDDGPRAQLWVLPASGGEAWQLTSARDGVTGYAWSPDARQIAFLTTDSLTRDAEARVKRRDDPKPYEGDLRMAHLWVIDVAGKQASKLTSGEFTVRGAPNWSPDGKRLAVLTSPTPLIRDERREAWIVNVENRERERVAPPPSMSIQGTPVWSPDGSQLAFGALIDTWKANGDGIAPRSLKNTTLVLYDVAAKRARDASSPSFDNSVGAMRWSNDGKTIVFTSQDRVYGSVFAYDVASGAYTQRAREMMVRTPSYSRDGETVAFAMDAPDSPAEVYTASASFASPRKLTSTNPAIARLALGETEVVTWKSPDGWTIEGILLKPFGYKPGQRVPLLVDVHGGPTGAHTNGFKASWGNAGHYWAGQGWAVLYPNPRGSTGYGEKFMRGNIKDWGGGDYRDIMSGVDALVKRGLADSDRLAVTGWSYGGYMTGWVVSQTGRFKAAMMGAGLVNMVSMYGTTDIPGYIGTFYEGMPQLDGTLSNKSLEFYRSRSAISYSDKVTTPLLMLHGGSDERVPIGQPMEFFRNLRDRGKTAELVFYPREGHGLGEYYHQIDKMKREYEWIARYTLQQEKVLQ
ncbi:MAG: S9 family peptidase [Gemmatimonadaceae bacterium]